MNINQIPWVKVKFNIFKVFKSCWYYDKIQIPAEIKFLIPGFI